MRTLTLAFLVFVASCTRDSVDDPAASEDATAIDAAKAIDVAKASDVAAADAWLGDWRGPEGTLLTIAGGQGVYRVTVRDLDGPRSFDGNAVPNGIAFTRDGVTETITATDGAGTGMKWLADKRDCLVIHPGEGFCRD
ncbi:MAG: hypothetical protein SV422_08495 [Pseudomonadota bacterium]|nr:hypothetical protein [Pseudomonadota bacterium]